MRRTRRRTVAAIAVAGALLALPSCGGRGAVDPTTVAPTTPPPTTAPATTAAPTTTSAAPTTTTEPTTTLSPAEVFLRSFEGEWTGTWTNSTFGSTGNIAAQFEVLDFGNLIVTVDLGGAVLGQDDPPEEQWILKLSDLLGPVTFQSMTFGEVTLILSDEGARLSAAGVPATGIASFQLDARFEVGPTIVASYLVGFDDGTTAEGTATIQRAAP